MNVHNTLAPVAPAPEELVEATAKPREVSELSPLIGAVPVEGPPAVLLFAPWILLALLLAGPFALLLTIVVAMLAAAVLFAALAALAASPFLLVRHLRAVRARHAAVPETPPARAPSPTSISLPAH